MLVRQKRIADSGWAAHMRPAFAPFARPCAARIGRSSASMRPAPFAHPCAASGAGARLSSLSGRPINVPDQIGIPYVPVGRAQRDEELASVPWHRTRSRKGESAVALLTIRHPLSAIRFLLAACLLLMALQSAHAQQSGYVVKPGDVLEISVWKEPDLQRQVLIRPDGAFSFPLVGQVDARGKTVIDLNKTVSERLSRFIADAVVTISVQQINGNKIYVLGQVNKPGEFIVNPSVNVMQALSMAGGMTPFAATNDIIVLRGQGESQKALPFRYADVVRGRNLEQNIDLIAGDIVVVP